MAKIDAETGTEARNMLMKLEMQQLLEEYARSMGVALNFTFDEGFGDRLFELSVTARMVEGDKEGYLREKDSTYAVYENNWHHGYYRRGLDKDLLGKTIEVDQVRNRGTVRYKILGLNTTSLRKKYCVAIQDLASGRVYGGSALFVKHGKVIRDNTN